MFSNRNNYPLRLMCRVLEASSSGYYRWRKSKVSRREAEDIKLLELIKHEHQTNRETYGTRRICALLKKKYGLKCNIKRIARLMKNNNIRAKTKKKFKRTTSSSKGSRPSANLLKGEVRNSRVWTSDITYLWTREGWMYLAVVIDVMTRKIIGWAADRYLRAELVSSALLKAMSGRASVLGKIIFHSDKGSQYTSGSFRQILQTCGISQSMGSSCYDNANLSFTLSRQS